MHRHFSTGSILLIVEIVRVSMCQCQRTGPALTHLVVRSETGLAASPGEPNGEAFSTGLENRLLTVRAPMTELQCEHDAPRPERGLAIASPT